MEKRTTLVLVAVCAVTLTASLSCGGKGPTDPTKGAATSSATTAAGDDGDASALGLSTMKWSLADRCPDGKGLQWRLFDIVNNKRYPTTGVYRTLSGGITTKSISCTTNHKICIGGTTIPATSLSFGVGLNGTRRTATILRSVACRACGNVWQRLALYCTRSLDEGTGGLEEDFGFSDFGAEESAEFDDADSE